MKEITKWSLVLALLLVLTRGFAAWNIGQKSRVDGPLLHTSYYLTPNNQPITVRAQAFAGYFLNGQCQYNVPNTMGPLTLTTGDFFDFDSFLLKSIMGGGYSCLTIYYFSKQLVIDTFLLTWDGFNYTGSIPPTSEVNIL